MPIDIESMTIKQAREAVEQGKEIERLLGVNSLNATEPAPEHTTGLYESMIGKYVLVRCHAAGVHVGVLVSACGRACVLRESRRLWRWRVPLGAPDFLSGVATHGVADGSKIGVQITVALTENSEIIECSAVAEKSIRDFATCTRTE